MENLLTDFEEDVLKDAIDWMISREIEPVQNLLDTNYYYDMFLKDEKQRKSLIDIYWRSKLNYGDHTSE